MVSSLLRLDLTQIENMWLFVCSEAVEYKHEKTWDQLYSDTSPKQRVFSGQGHKTTSGASLLPIRQTFMTVDGNMKCFIQWKKST